MKNHKFEYEIRLGDENLSFRTLYHYEQIGKFSMVPVHHVRLKHIPNAEIIITRRGGDVLFIEPYVFRVHRIGA